MIKIQPLKDIKRKRVRVVLYNTETEKVHSVERMLASQVLTIEDPEIISNPDIFMYKYQILEDKWINASKYHKLIDPKDFFEDFIFQRNKMKVQSFHSLFEKWDKSNDESTYRDIGKITYLIFRNLIWGNVTSSKLDNTKLFISYIRQHFPNSDSMLSNVVFYIENYIFLREKLENEGINDFQFGQKAIPLNFFNDVLERCIVSNFQLAHLLAGKIYSLLGKRDLAVAEFVQALRFNPNYLPYLSFEEGINTFKDFKKTDRKLNDITFISSHNPVNESLFLISCDIKFLRYYGAQLLYYISILKKYHFHFHVVGDPIEIGKVVSETESLFNQINNFRGASTPVIRPTFSTESIPDYVIKHKTYSASSRYLVARRIMEYFKTDVLIMDADMFFENDPGHFIQSQRAADITLPFSKGIVNICPWRRILAGNVYLKNVDSTKEFLRKVEEYTLSNLDVTDSWMLDQNALLYAYEVTSGVNIGARNYPNLPFVQKPLGRFAETV